MRTCSPRIRCTWPFKTSRWNAAEESRTWHIFFRVAEQAPREGHETTGNQLVLLTEMVHGKAARRIVLYDRAILFRLGVVCLNMTTIWVGEAADDET